MNEGEKGSIPAAKDITLALGALALSWFVTTVFAGPVIATILVGIAITILAYGFFTGGFPSGSAAHCIEEEIEEIPSAEKISFTDGEGVDKARRVRLENFKARISKAKKGDVEEQYMLSQAYRNQSPIMTTLGNSHPFLDYDHLTRSLGISLHYLKMAAENGHGIAQRHLGIEYCHGMKCIAPDSSYPCGANDWDENNPLTERDLELSIRWLAKAEASGVKEAKNELQMIIRAHNDEVETTGKGSFYCTDNDDVFPF